MALLRIRAWFSRLALFCVKRKRKERIVFPLNSKSHAPTLFFFPPRFFFSRSGERERGKKKYNGDSGGSAPRRLFRVREHSCGPAASHSWSGYAVEDGGGAGTGGWKREMEKERGGAFDGRSLDQRPWDFFALFLDLFSFLSPLFSPAILILTR